MFVNKSHLPHLLAPELYCSAEQHAREIDQLFKPAWHCVATTADLPKHGNYLTLELFGRPLLVRNCDGEIRAFLNVCSHRHSTLTDAARGSCDVIRCQYHGWEYDREGDTRRIPDARSFKPLEQGALGLRRYRCETIGQLVFVTLDDAAPGLADFLGPVYAICQRLYSSDRRQIWHAEPLLAANWKIAVENNLESYHIECVHKKTLVHYPAEDRCEHELTDRYTAFRTNGEDGAGLAHWLEGVVVRSGGRTPTYDYLHLHAYPNMMCVETDMVTIVQTILPRSPGEHQSIWRMFLHQGGDRFTGRAWARVWEPLTRGFWTQVIGEDAVTLPKVHRGLSAPAHAHGGLIATREERIWHFQEYVRRMCLDAAPLAQDTEGKACSCSAHAGLPSNNA